MNPTKLPQTDSFCVQLAALFRARPGEWINARDLMARGGTFAWRTRVADLRRPPFSMAIENRQRRGITPTGEKFTISEYVWRPPREERATGSASTLPAAEL